MAKSQPPKLWAWMDWDLQPWKSRVPQVWPLSFIAIVVRSPVGWRLTVGKALKNWWHRRFSLKMKSHRLAWEFLISVWCAHMAPLFPLADSMVKFFRPRQRLGKLRMQRNAGLLRSLWLKIFFILRTLKMTLKKTTAFLFPKMIKETEGFDSVC